MIEAVLERAVVLLGHVLVVTNDAVVIPVLSEANIGKFEKLVRRELDTTAAESEAGREGDASAPESEVRREHAVSAPTAASAAPATAETALTMNTRNMNAHCSGKEIATEDAPPIRNIMEEV